MAQSRSEQAGNICQQLVVNSNGGQLLPEHRLKEVTTVSDAPPPSFIPETLAGSGEREQSAHVVYTQRGPPFADNSPQIEEDQRKTAAAAVAAKLAASTSSAQMLSFVLSSLASEGVIGNTLSESSMSDPFKKRPKLENGPPPYVPPQLNPPLPPFPHPESLQHKNSAVSQQMSTHQLPPPHSLSSPLSHPGATMQPSPPLPPMPPPMQPPPPSNFMQTAGSLTMLPHSYGTAQRPPPLPGYAMVGTPDSSGPPHSTPQNPYQNFQASDGGFYSQLSLPTTPLQQ